MGYWKGWVVIKVNHFHGENPPLLVITGPTATGKSNVAVTVSEMLGGEVISADSMLIYRHMDIGTAKPSAAERRGIPHHLIDIVNPDEEYSVALFQQQARAAIKDVLKRGKLPLLVGGTGLYVNAVIDSYDFSSAGGDRSLREKLKREIETSGAESLHQRLKEVDPRTAERLHPKDSRRVARALEVYYRTGRSISSFQYKDDQKKPIYNLKMFGLTLSREVLYRRIEERVDEMIGAGLVDEVRGLLARGYAPELPAMRGLGYKEIITHLLNDLTLKEAVTLLKRNTRRFAKRQLTWFRKDNRIEWLDVGNYGNISVLAQEISAKAAGVFLPL